MIVPMEHLILLCSQQQREAALKRLAQLGCVHVTLTLGDTQAIRAASAQVTSVEQAMRILDVAQANGVFAFKPDASSTIATLEPVALAQHASQLESITTVAQVNEAAEAVTLLRDAALALQLQVRRYEPFGSLSPEKLTQLEAAGLSAQLFTIPEKEVSALEGATHFLFGEAAGQRYGLWMDAAPLPSVCEALPAPAQATSQMTEQIGTFLAQANALVQRLATQAETLREKFAKELDKVQRAKTFVNVSENLQVAGEIAYLQGYLPKRLHETVVAEAQAQGWGVVLEAPDPEDMNVPVLLEPPKCFRAITALFKGLNILPAYNETDISVPFYAFFTLFFAMLIGDAGYGALMLVVTLFAWWKLRAKKAAKPVFILFTIFAASTVGWGILTGTYFGIPAQWLPEAVTNLPSVKWLGTQSNIMMLCFILGATHLSIARVWNAVQLAPDTRALAQLGWVGVIWSMFCIICGIVVEGFHQPSWTWYLMGGSALLIALFMLKPSELKTRGADLGMLPLNIVSSMGDIISYVRLFAVGLASVKVAENFNEMAVSLDMPLWAKIPAMVLILLLGHGINIASGALSILVHAVRLNTLEFSSAKGITWSGTDYKPFKE